MFPQVQDNSPGSKAGLEPFFDFIISINGARLLQDDDVFRNTLKDNLDRPVELELYNAKHQGSRKVILIPSVNWGGQGLLGVSIRFCSFDGANQNVWHVLVRWIFSLFCMRFSSWWYRLILGRLSWIASGCCSTSAVLWLSDWRRHFTQGGWFSKLLNYCSSVCTRLIDWLIDWLTVVDWWIDWLIDWVTVFCHRFRCSRKICTRWLKLTKENHWNYTFTIRTRIHVGKWRLCRTVTGVEKEGMLDRWIDRSIDWLIDWLD